MNETKLFNDAREKFGSDYQIIIAIEEMSELTKVLTKYLRDKEHIDMGALREEVADVEIMLKEIKLMFGYTDNPRMWEREYEHKLERLYFRVYDKFYKKPGQKF